MSFPWRLRLDNGHNDVRVDLIAENGDDLLRVAGSLKLGAISASEFMRTIQSGSRTSTLVRATAELGCIAEMLLLLAYIDDEVVSPTHPGSAQPRRWPASPYPRRVLWL